MARMTASQSAGSSTSDAAPFQPRETQRRYAREIRPIRVTERARSTPATMPRAPMFCRHVLWWVLARARWIAQGAAGPGYV